MTAGVTPQVADCSGLADDDPWHGLGGPGGLPGRTTRRLRLDGPAEQAGAGRRTLGVEDLASGREDGAGLAQTGADGLGGSRCHASAGIEGGDVVNRVWRVGFDATVTANAERSGEVSASGPANSEVAMSGHDSVRGPSLHCPRAAAVPEPAEAAGCPPQP
jgi:hypothetical protein